VTKVPDLRERHLGVLQGLTSKEAPLKEMEAWQALRTGSDDTKIPGGGESRGDVFRRATTAIDVIAGNHPGQTVAVLTHGGVLAQLQQRAAAEGRKNGSLNCSINSIVVEGQEWAVLKWGGMAHISGAALNKKGGFGGGSTSG